MNSEDVEKLDFDQFYQNSTSAGAKYQERSGVKEVGGPRGLGDPNDMSLSKHEKEQLIPQRVFDTVSRYHCKEVSEMYDACCENNKMTLFYTCRDQSKAFASCLRHHFYNPELHQSIADEFLMERSHFRNTGIKTRRYNRGTFLTRPDESGPALDSQWRYRKRIPDLWYETYGDKPPSWSSF